MPRGGVRCHSPANGQPVRVVSPEEIIAYVNLLVAHDAYPRTPEEITGFVQAVQYVSGTRGVEAATLAIRNATQNAMLAMRTLDEEGAHAHPD